MHLNKQPKWLCNFYGLIIFMIALFARKVKRCKLVEYCLVNVQCSVKLCLCCLPPPSASAHFRLPPHRSTWSPFLDLSATVWLPVKNTESHNLVILWTVLFKRQHIPINWLHWNLNHSWDPASINYTQRWTSIKVMTWLGHHKIIKTINYLILS